MSFCCIFVELPALDFGKDKSNCDSISSTTLKSRAVAVPSYFVLKSLSIAYVGRDSDSKKPTFGRCS